MFIIFVIGFVFWLICFAFWKKNKDKKHNAYIELHKQKINEHRKYFEYLKWCENWNSNKDNEVIYPMNENEWKNNIDKEKYLKQQLNK